MKFLKLFKEQKEEDVEISEEEILIALRTMKKVLFGLRRSFSRILENYAVERKEKYEVKGLEH